MLDSLTIRKKWGVSITADKKISKRFAYFGVLNVFNPYFYRQFSKNNRALNYSMLPHPLYAYILEDLTTLIQIHIYVAVLATKLGWSIAFLLKNKRKANEGMSLLFYHDGILIDRISSVSKRNFLVESSNKF